MFCYLEKHLVPSPMTLAPALSGLTQLFPRAFPFSLDMDSIIHNSLSLTINRTTYDNNIYSKIYIGIDTGGTCTDAVLLKPSGQLPKQGANHPL
jgi:hypothetical protein